MQRTRRLIHQFLLSIWLVTLLPLSPIAAVPTSPTQTSSAPAVSIASPGASPSIASHVLLSSPPLGCVAPVPTDPITEPPPAPQIDDTIQVFLPLIQRSGSSAVQQAAQPLMASSPSLLVLAPSPTEPSEPQQIQSATIGGATDFSDTVAWIYTGTGAIQQSINPAIIGPLCVGVIRGQVIDRAGVAMAGVQVSIHGRDDYGYTTTQNDGRFSLAVNGGETFVVNYVRNGYLPVQRQVTVPRREYAWADPVALVPLDSKVTTIAPDAAAMQVITGNTVNDSDGQRTATLLVPAGTSAEMVMADGSTQPLGQLAIRATEYTVGDTGLTRCRAICQHAVAIPTRWNIASMRPSPPGRPASASISRSSTMLRIFWICRPGRLCPWVTTTVPKRVGSPATMA